MAKMPGPGSTSMATPVANGALALVRSANPQLTAAHAEHVLMHSCDVWGGTVNGEDLGVYSHVETLDKDFLERHFPDASGNLYESGGDLVHGDVVGQEVRQHRLQEPTRPAHPQGAALDDRAEHVTGTADGGQAQVRPVGLPVLVRALPHAGRHRLLRR